MAVVAGVATGMLLSLGATGLVRYQLGEVTGAIVTATLAGGALTVFVADLARLARLSLPELGRRWVAGLVFVGALFAALAADATLALSLLLGALIEFTPHDLTARLGSFFEEDLPFVLVRGEAAPALAAVAAIASFAVSVVALRKSRIRFSRTLLVGVMGGVVAAVWMLIVRIRTGSLSDDHIAWRYYLACVWLAVVTTAGAMVVRTWRERAARLLAGVIAGAAAAVVGSVGYVVMAKAFGSVLDTLAIVSGLTAMTALPLATLTSWCPRRPIGYRHLASPSF